MKVFNRIIDASLVLIGSVGGGMLAFSAIDASLEWGMAVGLLFGVVLIVGWWFGKSGEES